MKFASIVVLALASTATGFVTPNDLRRGVRSDASLKMSLEKYADELKETAKAMVRPGRGLLACDESTGTVGTRLEGIGMRTPRKIVAIGENFYLEQKVLKTSFQELFYSRKLYTSHQKMAHLSSTC
jgi:hypothetical protein